MKLDPKLFAGGVNVAQFNAQMLAQFTADASPGAVLSLIRFLIEVNRQNRVIVMRWAVIKKVNAAQVGLDVEAFAVQLAELCEITIATLEGEHSPEFFGAQVVGPLIFGNWPDGTSKVSIAASVVSVANQIGAVNLEVEDAFGELVADLTLGLVDPRRDADAWTLAEKIAAAGVATVGGVALGALLVYSIRK